MNCTPKVGYPLQPAKVQFFMIQYTLHFKHQAVFHYLRIRSRPLRPLPHPPTPPENRILERRYPNT